MEIAAGKIAEIVVAAVQAYTGNIGGLASLASDFVSNISTMTASFGYSAVDEESHKSHVIFDHATDYFLMCKLDKVSKKRKANVPLFSSSKVELTVIMYFVKIKAGNDAARLKLQRAANDKSTGLFDMVKDLQVF